MNTITFSNVTRQSLFVLIIWCQKHVFQENGFFPQLSFFLHLSARQIEQQRYPICLPFHLTFFLITYLKNFKQPRFITQSQPHPYLCLWQMLCCIHHSGMFKSLRPHGVQPARLLCPWNSPGKHTGVGCHFLLQGIVQPQVMNPCHLCLLHQQAGS